MHGKFQHTIMCEARPLTRHRELFHRYISLLRLLRLGRAYRLFGWVTFLTYNQTVSLLMVTLVRNFMVGAEGLSDFNTIGLKQLAHAPVCNSRTTRVVGGS
jgi:hypothetical protein